MLLRVCRYPVYCFTVVEATKSAKNIWEPVIENVIIVGFLMADNSSKRQKYTYFVKYVTFLHHIEQK